MGGYPQDGGDGHELSHIVPKKENAGCCDGGDLDLEADQPILSTPCTALLSHDEAPVQSTYPHVLSGYRPCMCAADALKSSFAVHCETFNIWSHAVSSILFFFLLLRSESVGDGFYLKAFCLQQAAFYASSAFYHIMSCCPELYYLSLLLDMAGMMGTVAMCTGAGVYVIASQSSGVVQAIHVGVFVVLVSGVSWSILRKMVQYMWEGGQGLAQEQGFFNHHGPGTACCMALSFSYWIVPALHLYIVGFSAAHACTWLGLEYAAWGMTFLIYIAKFPERAWPGKFDYFGMSHNIFHVCIVGSSLFHYFIIRNDLMQVGDIWNRPWPFRGGGS